MKKSITNRSALPANPSKKVLRLGVALLLLNSENLLGGNAEGGLTALYTSSSGLLSTISDIDNGQQEQTDLEEQADKADKKAAYDAQQKALQAAARAKESWKKVQDIAAMKNNATITLS